MSATTRNKGALMDKEMPKNENANSGEAAGVGVGGGGEAKATKQRKRRLCGDDYIKDRVREVKEVGLQLHSADGATQLATLPRILQYFGPRGLNTYEGVALGYLRIATRIKELKEHWEIQTVREDVIGPDGLYHVGIARYILTGKKRPETSPEVPA